MSVRNEKRKKSLLVKKAIKEKKKTDVVATNIYQNYLLTITYDGSTYGGYAKQKFSNTISETLDVALNKYLNTNVKTIESSRTDSKVHAIDQKVSFKCYKDINLDKFITQINELLPNTICVLSIEKVAPNFHPQYNVKNKTYIFKVNTEYNIFLNNYSYFWNTKKILTSDDISRINDICSLFTGTHDFIGFTSTKRDSLDTTRKINFFKFKKIDDTNFRFEINASGFLYNMIRILVPTILDLFVSNSTFKDVTELIESKDRSLASDTISGSGLYLSRINFK